MKNLFTCLFNAPEAKNHSLSSQLDSLSIVSRQSDLAKYVATLTLFLCLGIGNVWGTSETVGYTTSTVTSSKGGGSRTMKTATGLTVTAMTSSDTYMPAYSTGDKDMGNKKYGYNTCQSSKTSRFSMACYNWKVGSQSGYAATNTYWTGFKVKVASGKKFSLSSANMRLLVQYNHIWRLAIEDSITGNRLATSANYTISSYNDCITNDTLALSLSDTTACQDLTGTFYVKMYFAASSSASGKYFCFPTLTVTGNLEDAEEGCSAYEFHYGTHGEDGWETACFEQVGETNVWKIENFTIPSTTHYYVGYHGDGEGGWNSTWSAEKRWVDWPTKSDNKWQGQIFLEPNDGALGSFAVGLATGATGTLTIHSDYNDYNKYLSFTPDGYGITYGGSGHAFTETATSNMYETDVVTLPDVSSTTYTMGFQTATAGTYVTGIHSSAAENINAMGVTILDGGYKKILFNPVKNTDDYTTASAKIAIWDATNSAFYDFMTDTDADGILEGYVPSSCTSISIVRLNSDIDKSTLTNSASTYSAAWAKKWNQSTDISVGDLLKQYNFNGWCSGDNCKETFTSTSISPATSDKGKFRMWANSASSNWYVHWIPYYVLTYDANGGSGTTAQTERSSENSTLTVSAASNGFTAPTGYQFAGWATSDARAGAGTVDYGAGDDYTLTSNATLYAVWEAKSCSVTFDKNSGSGGSDGTTATYDAAMTTITVPTRTGYDFAGYWDSETDDQGDGTKYYNADGTSAKAWDKDTKSATTLYAKWTAKSYTVTLDPDNGNSTKTVTATYDAAMPSTTKPSYTGYTFRGYYDDHAGAGTQYYTENVVSATNWDKASTATLYAKWTQSITLDRNGGDGSTNKTAQATYKGSGPFAPSGTQTYSGHTLVDYRTLDGTSVLTTAGAFTATNVSDGSSVAYISGGKWVKAAATTLYAHWKCNTPTISCTNNVVTITVPSGSTVYYTTDGSTTPTSSSTAYDPEAKPVIDETTTFKAIAIQDGCTSSDVATQECEYVVSYSVTYNENDKTSGSAPSDATAYSEDATVTVKGNTGSLARTGYVFCGWSTSYGGGSAYAPGETFTITSNVNLYPIWAEGTSATITYTLNVGTSANTTIKSSATDNSDHIDNVDIDQTYDGADGAGAENRTTKLAIKTGANGATYDSPEKYELFKFSVATGYSFTPSDITIKIANVGGSSANNIKYKAVLSDGNSHSISTTYICTTQNGTVETFHLYNTGTVAFSGNVTLKLWAWTIADKKSGGSAFRMGTPLTIEGGVSNVCTALTAEGGTGTATSITKTGASLPYTLTNTTGVASVTIKVYDSEDNLVETIAGLSAAASGSGSATSLSAGTTYYYTVTPIASSGYCDGEESEPSDEFTTKYGVTYAAGVTLTSGSVPTDANAYDEGDDATVLGNTGSMVYTGYTFRGWTDGTTFFLAGQTFSITGNTTLTAVWEGGSGDCSWGLWWFYAEADRTTSGFAANNLSFLDQGTSNSFSSTTYNGLTGSYRTGNTTPSSKTFTIPSGKTGQLYFIGKGGSSRTIQLKQSSTVKYSVEPGSSEGSTCMIDNIAEGTYELTSSGNIAWSVVAIKFCSGSSNFDVTFADGNTAPASHTTWPDDIEGVPSGKKIVQPADPTADDYIFGGWYVDAACTNAFNFSGTITKDTTLYAKWSALRTVTWMVNGSEYTTGDPTTETEGSITTMPTAPADNTLSCADSFRGWSTTNLYGESGQAAPASLFVTAADAPSITKDTVFYAIFGDAAPASATSFTTTFTSKAWADTDSKWNSGKDGSNLTSGRGIQVSTTTTGANATTKAEYKAVTSVVVTYSTNASSGAGSIEIKVGGTAIAGDKDVTKTGGTDDRTITYTPATSLDGKVKITVNTTDGSIFIKSVEISHSGTFENYRCICPTMTVTPQLVTASTPIFITSAASKTVRSQDSLLIVGSGLSKSTAITLSSPASKFELRSRTNGVISTDATGSIDTVAYIYYTPGAGDTSDGLDKNANFTVSVAGNGAKDVTVSQALIGRHVPANFVIAAKVEDKWYALPSNMSNASSNPIPVEITVDDDDNPTSVTTNQLNVYSLYGQTNAVINGGNGQYVKLAMLGQANAPLFGQSSSSTIGKSGTAIVTNDLSAGWWWKFVQYSTSITNPEEAKYRIYGANNPTKHLYIQSGKWGQYASGVDELRLIPWTCSDPDAPTISGETTYAVGETISLTATCASGADEGTAYTWYKGADWATASAADPVQAAAFGSSGYTFTKASCVAGDAGTYWCEASNGSGCEAHNATGYTIDVPLGAHTLTWEPNVNTAESSIGTHSKNSTTSLINKTSDMSYISNYGSLTITSSAKTDLTSKIEAPSSYTEGEYMYVTFTVPSGYSFTPSSVSVKVQPVDGAGDVKLILSDASGHSINATQSSCTKGSIETVTMNNAGGTYFVGTVTLKIYCYGASTGTYRLGSPITIDGALEELSGYLVTYNGNGSTGGSVPVDASSPYDAGATVTVLGNTGSLERNGYEFNDWNTTAEGDGTPYKEDDTFTMPGEDVVLYAQWTPNTYTITYNLNGASWASSAGVAEYTVGTGATLPLAGAMTNTGYAFGGWYDNSGLTGSAVTEITTSDYGNKTFWAKWTENLYDVTYDANGGSGTTAAQNDKHYVTLQNNGFTAPSGKIFASWNTKSDGTGLSYSEGEEIELTADLKLYAIWASDYDISWGIIQVGGAGDEVTKPNLGGGNYTITATISTWTGDVADIELDDVTEGVTAAITSTTSTPSKTVTITFSVGTDVDGDEISFTLNVPAHGSYGAKESTKNITIERCEGSGSSTVFSLTSITGIGDNLSTSGKNVGASYDASSLCTLNSGSDGVYVCACSSSGSLSNKNLSYNSTHKTWTFSSSNIYLALYSATGFAAGDVITWVEGENNTNSPAFAKASASTLDDLKTTDYYAAKATYQLSMSSVTAPGSGNSYTYTGTIPAGFTSSNWLIVFRNGSSFKVKSITVIRPDASELIAPTLTWTPDVTSDTGWDGTNNRLNKGTSAADFTFAATQDTNSAGVLTYESSNTSVATVNATGKVHIVAAGDATITATLAESGCYDEATASYKIHVEDDCDDVAGTVTKEFIDCSTGYRLTVSGHTAATGVTYQWYKDDVSLSPAGQAATYETKTAGEYYVVVTNTGAGHCAKASTNTVTVEAMAVPTATKLLDSVFVKNGRRTPDIALVQTEGADNFQVKSGETEIWNTQTSVTTGFAGCSFYLGTNGIIYLMGQQPDGTEPSGLTAGKETLTFIASSCGGSASGVNIEIHKQAETTYKEIAFVVDGTKNGAWNAVTSGHADGTMLYEYLDSVTVYNESTGERDRLFKLYERNIYKTTDEKALREHYSQFDAILITDDPNTRTVPDGVKGDDAYKTKGYVNAMGALIDFRPILTMEAFVSALANWKAKGIDGNPTSPNPRQYAMKLDCKNHAIFVGIDPESSNVEVEDIDGVEYWTVAMVDSTKSPYSGIAYNSETDDKPALQGFSASDVSSLMLLGEISGGTLYAGVERQEEAAARLLLLGLNNKALPNALTPEGKKIIENTLKYLIETDMEKVDDCSNYFIGTTSTDWNTASNWSKGIVPNSPYVKARILKPCVLSGVTTKVSRVDIATSGKSMHLPSGECSGSLTINPTGALIVGGAVRSAIAPYFNAGDLMPTEEEDLVLNTNSSNQAALIFNNDKGDTKATVNLYSLGRKESDAYQFQYMAIPMEHVAVNPAFAGSGIYTYVWQENGGWERRGYYTDLYAFEGVGITTKFATARDYQMKGTLTSTKSKDIALTKEDAGENIIGNSWTAPLNIASMTTGMRDDDNIEKTVYIYITGNDKADGEDDAQDGTTITPGQWLAIPVDASDWPAWDGLKYIPSMQAYYIKVTGETTLSLDYKTMVRDSNKDSLNVQLRAPQRKNGEEAAITLTKLRVEDSKTHTDLYLFEGDQFSEAYDNGWEAKYMEGDGRSAQLYAMSDTTKMAVLATSDLEGTVLGFAPGKEMTYTFTFFGAGNGYYLNDLKLRTATLISEENNYEFTYEEGDTNRFYISRTPINTPAINTGTDDTRDRVKARKILYNNKLYILLNGRVYSAEGAIVK